MHKILALKVNPTNRKERMGIFSKKEEEVRLSDPLEVQIDNQEEYLAELKAQATALDQTVRLQKQIETLERAAEVLKVENEKETEVISKALATLKDEIEQLKREKATLDNEHKIAEEDVKHLMKIHEESVAVEKQKFELDLTKKSDEKIAKIKDEHQEELKKMLTDQLTAGDGRFEQILAILGSGKKRK